MYVCMNASCKAVISCIGLYCIQTLVGHSPHTERYANIHPELYERVH